MTPDLLAPALLERWMRDYYFDTDLDLGSSGVEPFSLAQLRHLLGLTIDDLDAVVLRDSRTLGDEPLREAIAARWGGGCRDGVMVTHGSSEAISLVMHALVRPGDEVVVLDPIYQQLRAIPEALGCRITPWTLRREQRFRPDVEEIDRLLGPKTRLLVLNIPHNPTGMALTAAEEDYIAERAEAHGAYILWDRAFADLLHTPDASCRQRRTTREISIGTLSKAYGLPGLRVGWCIADPGLIAVLAHLRDYTTLHLSPLVELVARRAIEAADVLLTMHAGQARCNLQTVDDWMATQTEVVEWVRPSGGVCGFPRLLAVADVEGFCRHLARTARVLLVPGSCFGHADHVRLGFGGAADALHEGLQRLSRALHERTTL
jgi:capreomycidine synthase